MNPLTGIPIKTGRVPSPDINWDRQPKVWISLATARLDGGFVLNAALLSVNELFAEADPSPEEVRIVDMPDGSLGVLTGETTLIRALLNNKAGLEARRYRP